MKTLDELYAMRKRDLVEEVCRLHLQCGLLEAQVSILKAWLTAVGEDV